MSASNPSPPASPGSDFGGHVHSSAGYESTSARSPGYPSPPASPPFVLQEHTSSSHKQTSMGPPVSVSRSASTASSRNYGPQSMAGYTSMTGASVVLQQPTTAQGYSTTQQHPPSKLATGGQQHAHRPVSAMPVPTDHSSSSSRSSAMASSAGGAADVFASMNANYAERRASAHPTMSSNHITSAVAAPASSIDASTSQAISSGIPITSPAALSYFAAHPRRQQVHFGNYLLLQTLGEGEFGKVKLGVHKEWGEEVAVKLIKRDKVATNGAPLNIDSGEKDPAKMSKVEREIQVLKDVRHPNIVRLYEVIESDRYIGIVLEYASGGELFDHILAHKYLKEDHACRLFAQLISGVSYLHQKKIVHRDLKLENLLLDRNRNVIITDFGFANNFEDKRNDLMATSCGSPCYAAPELVVQDGLYAGSAVDVWSCGVILYAMLAGYLPFDDDPSNPDGDNINLLYKYILATPLSFPEYITAEPRDLLSKMLVPDPTRRATLEQVMQHSWLRSYRELFKFSVEDLERAAMEQQTKKRQLYRQQMMYQQQLQEQQRRQQMERSQSARQNVAHLPVGTAYSTNTPIPSAPSHRQTLPISATVPDRLFEPSLNGSNGSRLPPVVPFAASGAVAGAGADVGAQNPAVFGAPAVRSGHSNSRAGVPLFDPVVVLGDARGEPRTRLDDTASGAQPTSLKQSAQSSHNSGTRDAEQRKPAAQKVQRHTIQLEYGSEERPRKESATTAPVPLLPPSASSSRQSSQQHHQQRQTSGSSYVPEADRIKAAAEKLAAAAVHPTPSVLQPAPVRDIPANPIVVPEAERITTNKVNATVSGHADMLRSASGGSASRVAVPAPIIESSHTATSSETKVQDAREAPNGSVASSDSRDRVPSASAPKSTNKKTGSDAGARVVSNPLPASDSVSFPPSADSLAASNVATPNAASGRSKQAGRPQTLSAAVISQPAAVRSVTDKTSKHRKGMSTDKFFLSRLLNSSNPENAANAGVEPTASDKSSKRNSVTRPVLERAPSSASNAKSSSRRKAMSLVVGGRAGDSSAANRDRTKALETSTAKGSTSSAVVEPEKQDVLLASNANAPGSSQKRPRGASTSVKQNRNSVVSNSSGTGAHRPVSGSTRQQQQDSLFYDGSTIASASTAGPSSNAAKKVMDWFRKKSLSRGTFNEQPPLGPFEHSPTTSQIHRASATPSVVVTGSSGSDNLAVKSTATNGARSQDANGNSSSSVPSSRSTSGTHSENSEGTGVTRITSATTETSHQESEGIKSSASTVQQQATPKASLSVVANVANAGSTGSNAASGSRQAQASTAAFSDSQLRFHLGAVDQSALTSRSPIDVLANVQRVLFEMGIDVRKEKDEDFKLECVRRKRAKTLSSAAQGFGMSIRSSVFPPSQADVERSSKMSNRDSLTASGSIAGGSSLRSFLRRGSDKAGNGGSMLASSPTSSQLYQQQDENQPPPIYGDASVDGGQEIRFSVEVTRIKNLNGLYSLDIRRMKGNLWAYKFVYHALLDRCQLGSSVSA